MTAGGSDEGDGSDAGGCKLDRRTFVGAASAAVLTGAMLRMPLAQAADSSSTDDKASGPVIDTRAGKVRGGQQGSVAYFKGVPYGASTAGERRFLPPQKLAPWSGVRDATQLGLRSPQLPSGLIPEVKAVDPEEPMGEDCLCLNVWTAIGSHTHRRPVMVWLHGGGFTSGSGGFTIYDGTNLAAHHDVVVVTVNHRLNVFGFLFLPDVGGDKYAQASNVGMLDIVQALEWVRDNIGASKVSTLMAMPAARGLFHRAIVQSGSAIKGVSREAANQSTAAVLAKLGIAPNELDKLQSLTMQQLLAAQAGRNRAFRFAPVVDGASLPSDPFDPVAPAISAHVPLLVGSTQDEAGFFPGAALDPIDESALAPRVKQTLHASDEQTAAVIAAYREDQPGISPIDIAIEVASDMFAWTNALTQAERKSAQHGAPVYMYYFTWKSPVREGKLRAFHTLDIPFAFDNVDRGRSMTGTGHDRYALQNRMSSAWTAFARTGNPNTPSLPQWPAYDSTQRATMILDNDCRLVNDPRPNDREALGSVQGVHL